jgi:ChrR Cupin-like domain
MEEIALNTREMTWEKLPEFPGNVNVMTLREEPAQGIKTVLVHLGAGGRISPHSHLGAVQHFVLEGEYASRDKTFPAGMFRLIPPHADMPPISTEQGATVLMIYEAPISSEAA